MMHLYHSPASPFARKVLVTLHETGQANDVTLIEAAQTPLSPDSAVAAQNPLGKIPTLSRPDGPSLYDSRVICRYLDHRAGGRLYPERRIWDVLTIEANADGILDAAVLMIYEARCRPEENRSADWVEAQWSKVARALDALENRWISHLSGPVDMGQIATGAALGYLDFRHGARDWRPGRNALAAWYDRFAARPSMTRTRPG